MQVRISSDTPNSRLSEQVGDGESNMVARTAELRLEILRIGLQIVVVFFETLDGREIKQGPKAFALYANLAERMGRPPLSIMAW